MGALDKSELFSCHMIQAQTSAYTSTSSHAQICLYTISSLPDKKLAMLSTASCALAMACRPFVSKSRLKEVVGVTNLLGGLTTFNFQHYTPI
jgi:hypothetical protein